ncbi:MAG: ABC transporter ATP-binding protein [Bryobacterales bacterium]|nr:ABC transporter ATP-binding protein [Bryobacterales bacterium]
MKSVIEAHRLTKRFRRNLVLDGLSFSVPEGAVYGLVGPNGAGKTTTLKILMNIHRANAGTASVLGVDSRRLGPAQFQQIGYVSENQQLPNWMTVGYFLSYLKPFYPTWDDDLAAALIHQFHLPLDRKLKDLSRGMWMKASLASSLAYRPKLLVLDEPFSGLDPLARDEFIGGMLERAEGVTILVSSHDLAEIESFSSHIGYLDEGRIRFSEDMQSLTNRFREIEITLDNPPPIPSNWPGHWLSPETSPTFIRFVDANYHPQQTSETIRRVFPTVLNVDAHPMPLRSIFVTLAKSSRKAA